MGFPKLNKYHIYKPAVLRYLLGKKKEIPQTDLATSYICERHMYFKASSDAQKHVIRCFICNETP